MAVNEGALKLLFRGASEVLPKDELEKRLLNGEKLRIKLGVDPTAPDLHLGHTVVINKLKQFQELGHKIIFLIGDFTASIGDPTGRNTIRPPMSNEEIVENSKTYQTQVFKILDPNKTEIAYNSSWTAQLSITELVKIASTQTVARMLERDDFSKRYKDNKPISIHEFLYPLLQGYDSVALRSDLELGGTDQKFNLLMGRELQRHFNQSEQSILTMPLLEGTDGVRKMSKSYGNYIGITESPNDIFGKIMSISDDLMWRYFDLLSFKSETEIYEYKNSVSEGKNPRDIKFELAKELVARFYDQSTAENAQTDFMQRFSQNAMPDKVPEIAVKFTNGYSISQAIKNAGFAKSTSEAIRLIKQGAVRIDGERLEDSQLTIEQGSGFILQVGKRRIAKISVV